MRNKFMKAKKIFSNSKFYALIFGILLLFLILFRTKEFCEGITKGLSNCVNIVLPSMFPFMIASVFLSYGELPEILKKPVAFFTEKIFNLPDDCALTIAISMIGGYPTGAKAATVLFEQGKITKSQAKRMLLFCFAPGLGFTVTAVGGSMLSSRSAGFIIFFSSVITSLLSGVILGLVSKNEKINEKNIIQRPKKSKNFSEYAVNAFQSCSDSVILICSFIAFFSGICELISNCDISEKIKTVLFSSLEVTNGCVALSGTASLPFICAICTFGGLCIHFQIIAISDKIGIDYLKFLISRVLQSAFSFCLCHVILKIFPVEMSAFAAQASAEIVSYSYPASISLIFLSVLLILDLEPLKKIC